MGSPPADDHTSAESARSLAELGRQERERLREAGESARIAGEHARVVAELARELALSDVRSTAETLEATLDHMEVVEGMRRTLREIRDLNKLDVN